MALLDRFRAQPRQKHADPAVRLEFVQEIPMDERELLAEMAREDPDVRVRRAAIEKLMDPAALGAIAGSEEDEGLRGAATAMLRDIALEAFEGVSEADSLAAVAALADPKALALVAKTSASEGIARHALERTTDVHALGSIARHAALEPIRRGAFDALSDAGEILAVSLNSDYKDTAVLAVDRLAGGADVRATLEQIVSRARNKSSVKRARGILREMDAQVAAEAAQEATALAEASEAAVGPQAEPDRLDPEALSHQDAARLQEAADVEAARERAVKAEAEAAECRRLKEEADARRKAEAEEARRREAEAREQDIRKRRETLARFKQLLTRVESIAARTDLTLKAGERALLDIRAALTDQSPLPLPHDHDEVVQRLTAAHTTLAPKVQELRDAVDWQQWANVGLQEQLCDKMEALGAVEDLARVAETVRDLQQQWKLAADVPREKGEPLWRRFKAAHDAAWARCESYFAQEKALREENQAKKVVMCEQAEALAESTSWIQTAEEIKRLQTEWKAVGAVSRGQERALWERFRTACDRFFTRRQTDLIERKKSWADNLAKKEALCGAVEALVPSTDWEATASEIRRLQAEWKAVGPVKKSRSEPIWQRFRAACDAFFARYAQRHDIAIGERVAAREAICVELEALAGVSPVPEPSGDPQSSAPESAVPESAAAEPPADLPAKTRALRVRWQQEIAGRGVDRDRALALDARYQAAFAAVIARWPAAFVGTELDATANRKRMETLVTRMEDLARSIAGPAGAATADASLSPATRMAAMLREALASNTIGGKVDDDSRLRAAAEEVRQAQANWSRIGPVAEDTRRALADRFQRACRRIAERGDGKSVKGKGQRAKGLGLSLRQIAHNQP